jgi:adenosylcobinamide-GDP ribazoletransferase
MSNFWLALSFLTVLPARQVEIRPGTLGNAGRFFPLIGLLIGGLLFCADWLAHQLFPDLLASAVVVALWAVLTGALHLDGFADCCDGLLASAPSARRLEIMRDPRTGAFAVVGLVLLLVLKVSAVASLGNALPALLLTPVWARWTILLAARQPPAQASGMGASFSAGVTPTVLLIAAMIPLALSLAVLSWQVLIAVALVHVTTWLLILLARRRLGGVTGDVYGLVVEVSELTGLIVFATQIG